MGSLMDDSFDDLRYAEEPKETMEISTTLSKVTAIDYLSAAIEDRVQGQMSEPMLKLAVTKISEKWPNRSFTRINPCFYVLDGFVFVESKAYKVTLESGVGGYGLITVKDAKETQDGVFQIERAMLDKDFYKQFESKVADAIVKLKQAR